MYLELLCGSTTKLFQTLIKLYRILCSNTEIIKLKIYELFQLIQFINWFMQQSLIIV